MYRQHTKLLFKYFIVVLLVLTDAGFAQRGFGRGGLGGQPAALGVRYDYIDPGGIQQLVAEFSQLRDLGRLPGASPLSYIATAMLAAGTRFGGTLDSAVFRWRAGLMDANFNRRLMMIGFTLLDFDRSGLLYQDFRWIQARLGLSKTFRQRRFAISGHFYGVLGRTTIELGQDFYGGLGNSVDSSLSGLETGFNAGVGLRVGRRFLLKAGYFDRVIVKNVEPHFTGFEGELRYYPGAIAGNAVQVFARWRYEESEFNDRDTVVENTLFTGGVQVSFRPPRRNRGSIWDD